MFKQGDIVVVPFPFSDLSGIKKRPVLVLSKDNRTDLITCGMTSNLKERKNSILIDERHLDEGFIPAKSLIKIDKLFTLNKSIILKKVARVDKRIFNKVRRRFYRLV